MKLEKLKTIKLPDECLIILSNFMSEENFRTAAEVIGKTFPHKHIVIGNENSLDIKAVYDLTKVKKMNIVSEKEFKEEYSNPLVDKNIQSHNDGEKKK